MATPFNFYYDFNHERPIPINENGAPIIKEKITPGMDKTIPIYVKNTIKHDTELNIQSDNSEVFFEMLPLHLGPGQNGKFKLIFSPKIDRIEPIIPNFQMEWTSG